MDIDSFISKFEPCKDATEFMRSQASLRAAWDNNKNPEWFYWLMQFTEGKFDKQLRLLACDSVRNTPLADGRKVWDLLTDERSKNAVEVAEKFANGEATAEELAAAWDAAWDAAWAAARAAARAAAWDAAWAAARAAARAAAWAAAWDAARAYQCDQFRAVFEFNEVMAVLEMVEVSSNDDDENDDE